MQGHRNEQCNGNHMKRKKSQARGHEYQVFAKIANKSGLIPGQTFRKNIKIPYLSFENNMENTQMEM